MSHMFSLKGSIMYAMTYTRYDDSYDPSMTSQIRSTWRASMNQNRVRFLVSWEGKGDNLGMEKINVRVTLMLSSTLLKMIMFAIRIHVYF